MIKPCTLLVFSLNSELISYTSQISHFMSHLISVMLLHALMTGIQAQNSNQFGSNMTKSKLNFIPL